MGVLKRLKVQNPETGIYEEYDSFYDVEARAEIDLLKGKTANAAPRIGDNGNWYTGDEDTGVKAAGADGQPGKDGYTPVKGVDYFDGEPGKDGQDGQPGKDGKDGADGAKGDPGTPGKSAYEYAQDGGYTGTEEEFAEKLAEVPLIGSTAEIMPVNVSALIGEGKPFAITHTDNTYGLMLFNSFVVSQAVGGVVSSTVFEMGGVKFCAQLLGNITNNTWKFTAFSLAGADDIPTIPTALPNPQKLIINGTPYDGSKPINYTSVINAMIDAKIAEIPNASGVSF